MRRERLISAALLLATAAVFCPVLRCQFINLDDWLYVTTNGMVRQGLTIAGLKWAFRSVISSNWHPLTWLSHMLDCQLFGVQAWGHHLVNLLFHAANTLLVFRLLRRMTAEVWLSAIVAAFFALHPLHVESVAWISERKDVLSTFFGLLSIWAYVRYVEGKSGETSQPRRSGHPALDYLLALVFFALGLMSKPMLVTWPFVLLLLDFWPLKRFRESTDFGLLLEKIPFFALSIASSIVSVYAQRAGESMMSVDLMPVSERIDNALISYARYLGNSFWPHGLCPFYPHPYVQPDWQVFGAAILLAAITVGVCALVRRRPYLFFGWFWFLGTLVPVIGLVQVGAQAMADRYMYIPSIGLFLMVVWGARDLAKGWSRGRLGMTLAAAGALAGCAVMTSVQLSYWKNSETLFRHALNVTTNNLAAEFLLGDALIKQRKVDEGVMHLENALRLNPKYPSAHAKLAEICSRRGRYRESVEHYRAVLLTKTNSLTVMNNLAWMLATNPEDGIRDGAEAVRLAERACEIAHYREAVCVGTLAAAYAEAGRYDAAIQAGEKARLLALESGQKELAKRNQELVQIYRQGKPFREIPAGPIGSTNSTSSQP